MATKKFEMTGSPKPFFNTKNEFVEKMSPLGWEQCKMTKRENKVSLLVCESKDSGSSKLKMATELGIEIITYSEIIDLFNL